MKRLLLGAVCLALGPLPAAAQAPSLNAVYPPGGKAGTEVTAAVSGAALTEVREVLVSGSGVSASPGMGGAAASLPIQLTIAADAPVGPREIRVVTAKGVSNAGRIWVGLYPDALEKEPNDALKQPQEVSSFPVTLSGRADKGQDIDSYVFRAQAGETWVFSLNAAGHHSALDGYLSLHDAEGRVVKFAMDNFERDPRLVHTFKKAGRYVLQVRDSLFRGGPQYTYRLSMGKLPVVTRWSPLGGAPGSTVKLAVQGVNLGAMREAEVKLPGGSEEPALVTVSTPTGPSAPFPVFPGGAGRSEAEPNDEAAKAGEVGEIPGGVSGWIGRMGDRDYYRFSAKGKQPVRIEVAARRLGSRLDSVLRVLDSSGKELARNDDDAGKDSALNFTPPADGDYLAEVSSLSGRGGDGYYYRLRLSPPEGPDYRLTVAPDNPTIPPGAAAVITVTAERRGGFNEEIPLRIEGLPAGVVASPAAIRKGQGSTLVTLFAPAGTAPVHSRISVVGSAKMGEQTVERRAAGTEKYQPPLTNQPNQQKTRETELLVGAVGAAPKYVLEVTGDAAEVQAGQKVELTVRVKRQDDFKEDVAVTVLGLPGNVKAAGLTIKKDQTEGKLVLEAAGNAAVGPSSVVVQGNGKNVVVAAPAVALTVKPAPPAEKK
ncbi:MAG: pre-peptidase C-terminal domain-containing protein [Armatimonadota bacterium]